MKKMQHIHTVEYYSALKIKVILTNAMRQVDLEDIMLSDINQSPKDEHCMIALIWGSQSSLIQRQRVEWWLSGAVGKGKWRVVFNGYGVSAGEDAGVLEMGGGVLHNSLKAAELQT